MLSAGVTYRAHGGNVIERRLQPRRPIRVQGVMDMTRFVIDAGVAIELAAAGMEIAPEHELLAPTLLRSEVLAALHEAVARGEITAVTGLERHRLVSRMRIRLLGDGVLRRRAWDVADTLGWPSTLRAEYVALTLLQADALITLDPAFASSVGGVVATASIDALRPTGAS
jgi:predicted nucleic acid-binding protein